MYACADTHEYQKRVFHPLELGGLVVVSHLKWVPKTEPQPSAKQQHHLSSPTLSPS